MSKSTEEKKRYAREHMRKYRKRNPDYVKREREHSRKYNEDHRAERLEYALKRQSNGKKFIDTFKDSPCMDCNQKFPPYVMDFDHVRGEKSANVGEMGTHALEMIIEEIAKCDLVCSSCHRIRTYSRQHITE